MTSLFEQGSMTAEMPVDLVARASRGVALLEFLAMELAVQPEEAREQAGESEERVSRERALQVRVMVDAAREDAAAETRLIVEREFAARLAEHRCAVERVCSGFAATQERYFAMAEEQVVRLALGIAARILCREVAADVLHLQATVRAALSRVSDGSGAVLRVQPETVAAWVAAFEGCAEGLVEVRADRSLVQAECVLETTIGRVELGVASQLEEIGRGFRELLSQGPMEASA